MSWYKTLIIFIFLSFNFLQASNFQEDQNILFALEHENQGNKKAANELYLKLFKDTHNEQYLIKYLTSSLSLKEFKKAKKHSFENLDKKSKNYERILRIYVVSLLNLKEHNKALVNGKLLLKNYKTAMNYEILANVYFAKGSYKKSVNYFESAYVENKNVYTLLNLVNVLYAYVQMKDTALAYLETHVRLYGCEYIICSKLLSIYQEQKNLDGIISVLKRTYSSLKEDNNYYSKAKTYKLLINYLEQKDILLAIKFLEDKKDFNLRLFNLYKKAGFYKKALKLVNKLYSTNSNIDLLAQIAILEFETAKDKKSVLKDVIKKFDDVLNVLNNHIYQNFLGYLLIDYNIDLKRGLSLINQALEQAPNNVAYLDSQAWAYYKMNNCKDAKEIMQKVVNEVGLTDKEIKLHWKKIKECKNK